MIREKIKYHTDIEQLEQLAILEREQLKLVTDRFAFRANDYYLSLINWSDPDDPIRKIIIPHVKELDEWGRLDPSDEKAYTIIPGLEHKYPSTALLLVSNVCEGICRYCFRKRVFIDRQADYLSDLPAALDYITEHTEITNVLMTGGDPLCLKTSKLGEIIHRLRAIDHVRIIRIGTKIPAFNPYRIIEDSELLEMIKAYSTGQKQIYMMTHFVHPRELTDIAKTSVHMLLQAGAIVANQSPLIRGINDEPDTLAELFAELSFIGAVPYYVFQCRPALGNRAYMVPVEEAYEIFESARSMVSGLAKRARFVMSHSTGKVEVVGMDESTIYFKYHRAADDADSGKFMALARNRQAYWFDDYEEIIAGYPLDLPYRAYGPQ